MSDGLTIGIDLGTSNSCVAAIVSGRARVLKNDYGEPTTASVVAFGEDGSITVGNQAKARVILDPKHTVSSAKRLIGRYWFSEEVKKAQAICQYEIVASENNGVRIRIREEQFSLPEISAFVLKEMKRIAEQQCGQEVTRAVITVPAYFNDNQRQATKDAGRIAGLEVMRILNEPTAAALAYGYGRDLKQKVVVYDLGGGTFDVSVLEIGADVYEVLATSGDTYLGGDDFDDRLIDVLADHVQETHGINVRTDPFAFEKLKAAAETAKIALSVDETTQVEVPGLISHEGAAIDLSYRVTRGDFEKLTGDLVQRTFKVCDEALQQAGMTARDLDGVILVGGCTRLPMIRDAVTSYFGRDPEADINPDEVVAVGAAIHANSLAGNDTDTYLLDVTPLSLKLGIAGGMTETIIERNSPVPIDHTRTFTPATDGQESVRVKIYQGESRAAEGNECLGEFEFSGYEPGPRDQVQLSVSFEISTEGIVKVAAADPKTGVAHSTTVSLSSGLSEDEIQSIIERGRAEDVARQRSMGPAGGPMSAMPPEAVHHSAHRDVETISLPEDDDQMLDLPDPPATAPAPPENEFFGALEEDLAEPDPNEPALKDLLEREED